MMSRLHRTMCLGSLARPHLCISQPSPLLVSSQSYGTQPRPQRPKTKGPPAGKAEPRAPYMFRKARLWLEATGMGTANALRLVKMPMPAALRGMGIVFKSAPMPTLRTTDMADYFGSAEHPMTAYKMLKYQRKMETDSLFLYIYVGVASRPIVRSYVSRWMRDSIWAALRENGYANTGRVLPAAEMPPGIKRPATGDLCGTLQINITNPKRMAEITAAQSRAIGQGIFSMIIAKLFVGNRPSPVLQPVQYPADFLPHWKKKQLLDKIEEDWEREKTSPAAERSASDTQNIGRGAGQPTWVHPRTASARAADVSEEEAVLAAELDGRWPAREDAQTDKKRGAPPRRQQPQKMWAVDATERRWDRAAAVGRRRPDKPRF